MSKSPAFEVSPSWFPLFGWLVRDDRLGRTDLSASLQILANTRAHRGATVGHASSFDTFSKPVPRVCNIRSPLVRLRRREHC
jgi:hypothetical protein